MARILRKILMVGLMVGVGAVIYSAAGPAGCVFGVPEEEFNDLPIQERMAIINQSIDRFGDLQGTFVYVAEHGMEYALEPLIERGARPDGANEYGLTALSGAASGGHKGVVRFLIERVGIDAVRRYGMTALHCAAMGGKEEMVRFLVEVGANKNAVNEGGGTALHCAAGSLRVGAVRTLVALGALVDVSDNEDKTALQKGLGLSQGLELRVEEFERCIEIMRILLDGYRVQLEREYPTRLDELFGDGEFAGLSYLGSLPAEVVETCIMNCMSDKDLGRLACTSTGCRKLAYNEMCRRFPIIKGQKFTAFINPVLECAREKGRQEMVPLLEQALGQGYAVVTRPAEPAGRQVEAQLERWQERGQLTIITLMRMLGFAL